MLHSGKVLAVITARAGSKGLPGKNFKPICGKPLIEWSIEAALQSKYIDDIAVSSNDHEIEKIVRGRTESHVYYVARPDELATPTSQNEDAILHAMDTMGDYKYVVLLQPTSPARKNGLIDKTLEAMYERLADSAFTASKHTPFFYKLSHGYFAPVRGPLDIRWDKHRPMRQELKFGDYMYHDNGNVYAFTEKWIRMTKTRICQRPVIVESDQFSSMQIDTEEDFRAMEALADIYGGFL